jgi:predicted helicase
MELCKSARINGMASVTGMSLSRESIVEERAKILLVDDSPENLVSLEASLEGLGQNLVIARSGMEALRHLLEEDFAAILLDVKMPDMDGFQTAEFIRSRNAAVDAHQCFPLSHLKDSAVAQFRQDYSQDSTTREDVFHYIYALLHHPQYRERYAANLKPEPPRIPFGLDFAAFAVAGKELAWLHVEYESLKRWPLEFIANKDVPYSERVTKMKLSADKQSIAVNESLTLGGIPPEALEYRLGSRSALEWVIDQYQVKGESDPNREDDPDYIVRLVGQVVRVSVETVRIVKGLPDYQ